MAIDMTEVFQHYADHAEKYGASSMGVAFGSNQERMAARYGATVSKMDFSKGRVTILDVGSGYGELIRYMPNDDFDYVGIDVTESSIMNGRRLFARHTFIHGDFMTHEFEEAFDYVLCSGMFNVKKDISNLEMFKYMCGVILKMYGLCRRAVIFNLISTQVNFFSEKMYYKSPVEMLAWCFDNIGSKVDLDHSSVEYEYFITLKK